MSFVVLVANTGFESRPAPLRRHTPSPADARTDGLRRVRILHALAAFQFGEQVLELVAIPATARRPLGRPEFAPDTRASIEMRGETTR
ncbi:MULTISPECIES: hypothetical protein [Burkholderia]|uniref:hypothetical protein n=1 Tax=Burkholderia TaxID=32008 RepID=UPI000761B611|nr:MULTISPECIES: hypothetical protein [Burkholderia]KWU20986.1 hypothetical protein AS149_11835 [Burkholderia cenocepacia]QRR12071.1 hypothetical protein GJG85_01085 [Burkholderia sp. MS389]QVN12201.1 hypothetical protein JYG37_03075 [Burkholderia sp. LAS2]RQU74857.1 hypothetical protein DF141_16530 [Burkholderia cenocepacia]RRA13623.1 hypothetical protein DF059_19300 [Burkholderia cenocepacia]